MIFTKQRLEERTVVAVKATLRIGGRLAPATLCNASSRGVLALVDEPPPRGTPVEVRVGDCTLEGQVRWRGSGRCGIALREQIDVALLLEGKLVPITFVPEREALGWAHNLLRTFAGY